MINETFFKILYLQSIWNDDLLILSFIYKASTLSIIQYFKIRYHSVLTTYVIEEFFFYMHILNYLFYFIYETKP